MRIELCVYVLNRLKVDVLGKRRVGLRRFAGGKSCKVAHGRHLGTVLPDDGERAPDLLALGA